MIFRARLGFERWEFCIPDSFLDSFCAVVLIFKDFFPFRSNSSLIY